MTSTKHTGPITPENSFEAELKVVPKTVLSFITPPDFKASVLLEIREAKNARLNSVIERNKEKELRVWNELIKPIVESYDLKSPSTGKLFQYKFFLKDITERDVDSILRETMLLCDDLSPDTDSFSSPDHKSYSIVHQVIGPLLIKENREVTEKNGKKTNLKIEFFNFLITLFPDKLNSSKSSRLPEFLEMLNRETELGVNSEEPTGTSTPQILKPDQQESGTTEKSKPVNFFTRREDKHWQAGFNGEESILDPLDGLHYIAFVLQAKGKSISSIDLYQALHGKTPDKVISADEAMDQGLYINDSKHAISDSAAKDEYLREYTKLENELLQINNLPEIDKTPETEMQRKEIETKIVAMKTSLKEKTFADSSGKKAQSNISKRLDDAYDAMSQANMKELAKHLHNNIRGDGAYGLTYTGSLMWDITIK